MADSGDVLRDISNDISSIEAPATGDTVEVSGLGDSTKKYVVGLQDSQIRVQGNLNDAANKSHAVFSGIVGGTAGRAVHFWPKGSAGGAPEFRGSVLCSEYSVSAGIGAGVTFSVNLVPFDTDPPSWRTSA